MSQMQAALHRCNYKWCITLFPSLLCWVFLILKSGKELHSGCKQHTRNEPCPTHTELRRCLSCRYASRSVPRAKYPSPQPMSEGETTTRIWWTVVLSVSGNAETWEALTAFLPHHVLLHQSNNPAAGELACYNTTIWLDKTRSLVSHLNNQWLNNDNNYYCFFRCTHWQCYKHEMANRIKTKAEIFAVAINSHP